MQSPTPAADHRHRAGAAAGGLRAGLQPGRGLRPVVVPELSAVLLAAATGLLVRQRASLTGIAWGAASAIGNALWGGIDWGRRDVNINVNRYNNINVNRKHHATTAPSGTTTPPSAGRAVPRPRAAARSTTSKVAGEDGARTTAARVMPRDADRDARRRCATAASTAEARERRRSEGATARAWRTSRATRGRAGDRPGDRRATEARAAARRRRGARPTAGQHGTARVDRGGDRRGAPDNPRRRQPRQRVCGRRQTQRRRAAPTADGPAGRGGTSRLRNREARGALRHASGARGSAACGGGGGGRWRGGARRGDEHQTPAPPGASGRGHPMTPPVLVRCRRWVAPPVAGHVPQPRRPFRVPRPLPTHLSRPSHQRRAPSARSWARIPALHSDGSEIAGRPNGVPRRLVEGSQTRGGDGPRQPSLGRRRRAGHCRSRS